MHPERPHLKYQINLLGRMQASCRQYEQAFQQIRQQLEHLAEAGATAEQQVQREHATALGTLEERVAAEYRTRCEQIEAWAGSQLQAVQTQQDQQLAELEGAWREAEQAQQKALENELWVLQSVCDENSDDSPVTRYERAVGVFENQQKVVLETLNTLNQRIDETAAYLSHCHASADTLLPVATLELGSAEENRQQIAEQSASALELSDGIFRLHLPQWICGWRAVGLSLLAVLVLTIPITAVKADLRAFANPDIARPNWEWLGLSALISMGAVVLIFTVLLLLVQQSLRSRFGRLLQAAANAQTAAATFNGQVVRELQKLRSTADKWQKQMVAVRQKQEQLLHGGAASQRGSLRQQFEFNTAAVRQACQQQLSGIQTLRKQHLAAMAEWRQAETSRLQGLMQSELQSTLQRLQHDIQQQTTLLSQHREQLLRCWQHDAAQAVATCLTSREAVQGLTDWPRFSDGGWTAPEILPEALPAGQLSLHLPEPPDVPEAEAGRDSVLSLPAVLRFPTDTGLSIRHDAAGRDTALEFVRTILLKLLTTIPPGRVQLTLIDPAGLGQSFAALMHLADFDELLISHRIWTESVQIRDRLQKVTEHMENVFQTYLRSEFETIEQYNASAGEVAEPYHFVVVAGFPTAFSEEAARHLASIITSGPRCGVHAIVAWNPELPLPRSFDPKILKSDCLAFQVEQGRLLPDTDDPLTLEFTPLSGLPASEYVPAVRCVGEKSKGARRVEVSFARIAPRAEELWTFSTADGIDLPIGRAGAARLQYLRLGRGTSQHVLIAGKTGSGKSTLLHILITNLALHYSPSEIQFFLIDFKKGVEFRTYAANQLPHARVVAIESDREFGLSVLERLDEILQERGEEFRAQGVQDLPAYRRQCAGQPMPRILLLIDEFQEFFVAEDRVSSRASLLLDRLIRQGRAFGIHVVLGSQTLGGAYSLARSTLGQIAVRVALQCSESDAHLILSEENSAARLLSRPGEAIYNDANGLTEGNHPFQIAWLNDQRRDQAIQDMLKHQSRMGSRQKAAADKRMIVFEGTVPPSAELCGPLNAWLRSDTDATRRVSEYLPVWVGEPVAIAPPACVELRRASGQNLLIVGQDTAMADSLLLLAALSCCHPPAAPAGSQPPAASSAEATTAAVPRFVLLHDGRDREALARFHAAFATAVTGRVSSHAAAEADAVIADLHRQLEQREATLSDGEQPELLLAIRNIGQFRSLRRDEDEFSLGGFGEPKPATPATQLTDLIKRGPLVGIHVIVWSDTFSNALRWLSSGMLREFENRIAFRMNQTDSASLVDTPVAASLSPGRAVLYRDQTGAADKFRPFAWPSADWLAATLPKPVVALPEFEEFDIDSITIE